MPTLWTVAKVSQTDPALAAIGYMPPPIPEEARHYVLGLYRNGTLVAYAEAIVSPPFGMLGGVGVAPGVAASIRWEVFGRALKAAVLRAANAGILDGVARVPVALTQVNNFLQNTLRLTPDVIGWVNGQPSLYEYRRNLPELLTELDARYPG